MRGIPPACRMPECYRLVELIAHEGIADRHTALPLPAVKAPLVRVLRKPRPLRANHALHVVGVSDFLLRPFRVLPGSCGQAIAPLKANLSLDLSRADSPCRRLRGAASHPPNERGQQYPAVD
jgi:hypothetical protein